MQNYCLGYQIKLLYSTIHEQLFSFLIANSPRYLFGFGKEKKKKKKKKKEEEEEGQNVIPEEKSNYCSQEAACCHDSSTLFLKLCLKKDIKKSHITCQFLGL